MKTEKELNELKQKIDDINKEIQELNEDELDAVTGGRTIIIMKGSVASVNSAILSGHHFSQYHGQNNILGIVGGADGPTAIFLDEDGDKQ